MRDLPVPSATAFLRLFAFFGAATVWMTHLVASWLMVPVACQTGQYVWLHLLTVVAVAISGGAVLAAFRLRQQRVDAPERRELLTYLDTFAIWMTGLFLFAILMAGAANFWLDACDRSFGP
jgi:hypothetical protein